jgi:hypothetical protein
VNVDLGGDGIVGGIDEGVNGCGASGGGAIERGGGNGGVSALAAVTAGMVGGDA